MTRWSVVVIVWLGLPLVAQEYPEVAEIEALESQWNEAHLRGDADAVDRQSAEGLLVTVPGMTVMTKGEAVGALRSGRVRFVRYETSDTRIAVHDQTAVVTGRLRRTRVGADGAEVEDDWRFTKVYARRAGGWQVVGFHASANHP